MDYINKACEQIEQMLREGRDHLDIKLLYIDGRYEVSITEVQSINYHLFEQEK